MYTVRHELVGTMRRMTHTTSAFYDIATHMKYAMSPCNLACSAELACWLLLHVENTADVVHTLASAAAREGYTATMARLTQTQRHLLDCTDAMYGSAAWGGHFGIVAMLYRSGYPLPHRMLESAALSGNLAMCQWLYSQGCILNGYAICLLLRFGSRDTVAWLVETGCRVDDEFVEYADTAHDPLVRLYLAQHCGIPLTDRAVERAIMRGDTEYIAKCILLGFPLPPYVHEHFKNMLRAGCDYRASD